MLPWYREGDIGFVTGSGFTVLELASSTLHWRSIMSCILEPWTMIHLQPLILQQPDGLLPVEQSVISDVVKFSNCLQVEVNKCILIFIVEGLEITLKPFLKVTFHTMKYSQKDIEHMRARKVTPILEINLQMWQYQLTYSFNLVFLTYFWRPIEKTTLSPGLHVNLAKSSWEHSPKSHSKTSPYLLSLQVPTNIKVHRNSFTEEQGAWIEEDNHDFEHNSKLGKRILKLIPP